MEIEQQRADITEKINSQEECESKNEMSDSLESSDEEIECEILGELDSGSRNEDMIVDDQDSSNETWGAFYSSEDSCNQPWNVNDSFQFQLQFAINEQDEKEMSIIDENAKNILDNSELSGEKFKERSLDLLKHLLNLENPKLTEQMVDFFLMDDVLRQFMNYLSRTETDDEFNISSVASVEYLRSTLYNRDQTDIEPQKHGYNVTEILEQPTPTTIKLLTAHLSDIVTLAFRILNPKSQGNFHHFLKLMESMLEFSKQNVLDLIISPSKKEKSGQSSKAKKSPKIPLIFRCIPYLRESPILQLVVRVLFTVQLTIDEEISLQKTRFVHLAEKGFLETILDIVLIQDEPESIADIILGASEAFCRFVEEGADVKNSEILFSFLVKEGDTLDKIIQRMVDNDTPDFQRNAIISVLHAICIKSKMRPRKPAIMMNFNLDDDPSQLQHISEHVCQKLTSKISVLCDFVARWDAKKERESLTLSGFSIRRLLTTHKICFLETLDEIFQNLHGEQLGSIPSIFWRALVDWIFEFKFNNAYHNVFFKIFQKSVKFDDKPTLKNLLSKTRIIPRMIQHYNEEKTGLKGYIVLVLNVIRLTAGYQDPNDYIPQLLTSLQEWKDFISILEEETMRQLSPGFKVDSNIYSSPAPTSVSENLSNGGIDGPTGDINNAEIDIKKEIGPGSKYAISLGFPEIIPTKQLATSAQSPKKKKNKKKRKSSKKGPDEDILIMTENIMEA